jgi:signal transduction histidine kinase
MNGLKCIDVCLKLRTPLTLILGPTEALLSNEVLNTSVIEQLQLIRRNGMRLLKLVNNLLDFSRIEAKRMEVYYQPTDLSALTRDISSVFRSACETAGLKYVVDCAPLPEEVFVDREMWEKIVLNLIANAYKYTLQGQITVSLHSTGNSFFTCLLIDSH